MPTLYGRAEVSRLKNQLDDAFERHQLLPSDEFQVRSDHARYLCVLVSGFVERAMQALVVEMARTQASPNIKKYVEDRVALFRNAKAEPLAQLVGSFSSTWRSELDGIYEDGGKEALDSLVNLRHRIAHGYPATISYSQVKGYYEQIQRIVEFAADKMCPT